jgi:hypothetical protein
MTNKTFMQAFMDSVNADAALSDPSYRKEAVDHVRKLIVKFKITNSEIEDVVITRKKRDATAAKKEKTAKPAA